MSIFASLRRLLLIALLAVGLTGASPDLALARGPVSPSLQDAGDAQAAASKKRAKRKAKKEARRQPKKTGIAEHDFYLYEHTILPGDTVLKIAGKYGVTVEKLLTWNDMTSPHLIKAGETLTVYSKKRLRQTTPGRYTVKEGDTLGGIARKHDMSLRQLKSMNRLRRDLIHPGDALAVLLPKEPAIAHMGGGRKSAYLDEALQLTNGRGYHIRRPRNSWGKPHAIRQIQRAFASHHKRYGKAELAVGDISTKSGGPLAGHRSHQRGLDVDVGFYRKGVARDQQFYRVTSNTLDAARTWHLIQAFIEQGEVEMMFIDHRLQKPLYDEARRRGMGKRMLDKVFQYPRGRQARVGIIRHEPGHDDHIHIRFKDIPQRRTSGSGTRRAGAQK